MRVNLLECWFAGVDHGSWIWLLFSPCIYRDPDDFLPIDPSSGEHDNIRHHTMSTDVVSVVTSDSRFVSSSGSILGWRVRTSAISPAKMRCLR